jgi:hypothetical protein
MNKLSITFLAALAACTTACVFVVDGNGLNSHSAWDHDWNNGWEGARYVGSGTATMQVREATGFHQIEVRGCVDVHAQIGAESPLLVTADDNLLDRVITRVEEGVLIVEMEPGSYRFRTDVVIKVTVPTLDALRITGSGDASLTGFQGGALALGVSGSGDISAHGSVDALNVTISGSGDLALFDLVAREVNVSIAGNGDVEVHAVERLNVQISGSGDVVYRGSPNVQRSIGGSGSVERD